MGVFHQRIANLSLEKRALLELQFMQKGLAGAKPEPIPNRKSSEVCILSFAQQRLWFLDQLAPGRSAYNISSALHLSGQINVGALEKSLNEIKRRHEALRTTFTSENGQPKQVIAKFFYQTLSMRNFSGLAQSDKLQKLYKHIDEEANRPFDLAQGPLFRTNLLMLGEQEHVLLITMHHIISDGWSMGVFYHELTTLYDAYAAGKPSPFPELPIQYADFALWQRQWLQGEVLENQIDYWRRQLDGAQPVLELPTDRRRPAIQTYRGSKEDFKLPKLLTKELKALSAKEGTTLYMTLMAAFQILLYRYTGQEDIIVGSPNANRNKTEIEGLIGFFVNTQAIRVDLSKGPSFRQLLQQVRKISFEADAHQDFPFEKLVEELQPERDMSRSPLVQVVFSFQNAPKNSYELSGLSVQPLKQNNYTAKFDLTLFLWEIEDALEGSLEYCTDLFDNATITRMVGHFQRLLESILENPDQSISKISLLTSRERHQLLVEWNDTRTDYPKNRCIHELFEEQVERSPDAVALFFNDQKMTYRELNERANQLAHYLRTLGVKTEVPVGICVERSLEMVFGLLGILKAGGVYLPLDTAYPKERLSFMLEDADALFLLTQKSLLDGLPRHQKHVICLDDDWHIISGQNEDNPASLTTSENLAYIIYTSGSTGLPKGVAVSHRAISRLICNTDYVQLKPSDTVGQASNASFDAATFEIWGALLNGSRLVCVPKKVLLSPKDFTKHIYKHHIDVLFLTTALFNHLVRESPQAFVPLRHLLFGGEAVDPKSVKALLSKEAPHRLLHVYGPTESTTFTTWHLSEVVPKDAITIPIGRPIANTSIYILDNNLQPAPVGIFGELYIGGDGLARGYLNRPDMTAEKFVPNPFDGSPGSRMYKTGDIARYLSDGNVEIVGRIDYQIKIRGFRIELGEIETVLRQHQSVREAIILHREDKSGVKRLIAYIVPDHKTTHGVDELLKFLKLKLPEYMLPSGIVLLDFLPLTHSGKVDRKALPLPDRDELYLRNDFVTPRNDLEIKLVKIWEEILKVKPIGINDNFFDIGGHSLLALQLLSKIEKVVGKRILIVAFYNSPTVRQIANLLSNETKFKKLNYLIPLKTHGSKPPFFCIHGDMSNVVPSLDSKQPFYNAFPIGYRGERVPDTIEDMATLYLNEICSIQAEGPYFIGGYSIGGMIAFEIALQLQKKGQNIATLFLIDPSSPDYLKQSSKTAPLHKRSSAKPKLSQPYLVHILNKLSRLSFKEKLIYILMGLLRKAILSKLTEKKIKRLMFNFLSFISWYPIPVFLRTDYWIHLNRQARGKYKFQTYSGRIIIVKSNQRSDDFISSWKQFASEGAESYGLPGDHFEILQKEQCAQQLVEILNKYLNFSE